MSFTQVLVEEIDAAFRDTVTWNKQTISDSDLAVWNAALADGRVVSFTLEEVDPWTHKMTTVFRDEDAYISLGREGTWARTEGFTILSEVITGPVAVPVDPPPAVEPPIPPV